MLAAVAGSARWGAVMRREMESLPEDVLRQAAMEKGPSGCATKRARIAQKILWERLHWPCADAPSQHVDRHGNKYTKTGVRYGHTYD